MMAIVGPVVHPKLAPAMIMKLADLAPSMSMDEFRKGQDNDTQVLPNIESCSTTPYRSMHPQRQTTKKSISLRVVEARQL